MPKKRRYWNWMPFQPMQHHPSPPTNLSLLRHTLSIHALIRCCGVLNVFKNRMREFRHRVKIFLNMFNYRAGTSPEVGSRGAMSSWRRRWRQQAAMCVSGDPHDSRSGGRPKSPICA